MRTFHSKSDGGVRREGEEGDEEGMVCQRGVQGEHAWLTRTPEREG